MKMRQIEMGLIGTFRYICDSHYILKLMSELKYTLLAKNRNYIAENVSLQDCIGKPLNVAGCTLFICKQGSAEISLNFRKYILDVNHLLIILNDSITTPVSVSADFVSFRLSISTDFTDELLYRSSSKMYDFLHHNPILKLTSELSNLLKGWQEQVLWISKPINKVSADQMVKNSLLNLFLAIENIISSTKFFSEQSNRMNRTWTIINDFIKLIAEHCSCNRSVVFYADRLCISTNYLYKIVVKELKITPKDIIDYYILSRIKLLLVTTNLSVNEIAEKLSFEDPSYLNRYFRRQVGVTLTEFRSNAL